MGVTLIPGKAIRIPRRERDGEEGGGGVNGGLITADFKTDEKLPERKKQLSNDKSKLRELFQRVKS